MPNSLLVLPHYRKRGTLAVIDANLIFGHLVSDYFPKIFGKGENEGLDGEALRKGFELLAKETNNYYQVTGCGLQVTPLVGLYGIMADLLQNSNLKTEEDNHDYAQ
jgi:hypothetical protein